jgi:hypothetical protein
MGSQQRRQRWFPDSGGVHSSRFIGSPAAVACEGNENLPSDFRPQAGPKIIGSGINSGSKVEPVLICQYQQWLYL